MWPVKGARKTVVSLYVFKINVYFLYYTYAYSSKTFFAILGQAGYAPRNDAGAKLSKTLPILLYPQRLHD